jgi:hypothetical protein
MPYRKGLLTSIIPLTLIFTDISAASTNVIRTGPAYATRCRLMLCSVYEVIGITIGSNQYPVPKIVEGAQVRGDGKCRVGQGSFMEDSVIVKSQDGEVFALSADAFVFDCRVN